MRGRKRHIHISIHAPAKGATGRSRENRYIQHNFNPRSREGSDVITVIKFCVKNKNFNPRSREGSDRKYPRIFFCKQNFNPRSREGSDRKYPRIFFCKQNFNPRSREGSDNKLSFWFLNRRISIHAPAKGATPDDLQKDLRYIISIHAPAKGATI